MSNIPIDSRPLENSRRSRRYGAKLTRPADLKETLSVTIRVRRRLGAHIHGERYWTKTHRNKRKYLSRKEFVNRYGATQKDLNIVADFAKSHGLKIKEKNRARRTIIVWGTVRQVNKAFDVKLNWYKTADEEYRGHEEHIHLPHKVADVVEGIFGLDNRRMARQTNAPNGAAPLDPTQVATFYNFPNSNAIGQTIGMLEFGGGYQVDEQGNPTDILAFFKNLGLVTPAITPVYVDGAKNSPSKDQDADQEIALDIDVAGSVAQGANIAVYFAPWTEQGWIDAITTAIHPNLGQPAPSVISISWVWAENEKFGEFAWNKSTIDAVSSTFQEAAMLGITIFVASGDYGSDCDIADGKAHVNYPASDPWVTACGGTIITNIDGDAAEDAWNDGFPNHATGGGISDIFDLPSWQKDAGIPPSVNDGHQGRGIPDVAGNASGYSGYIIPVGGVGNQSGGTSAVAPLYAGLVALINSNLGKSVSYLNPTLYDVGQQVCNDIDDGIDNGYNGAPGYKSGPNWDACTGWGSINGNAFLAALKE